MPIYEYRCSSCGTELEKLQKISDPPLLECPECGKDALVKLISASSFRLKGSGWYETDFKTGKKNFGAGDASAEGTGGTDSAGSASAPTATAPESANGSAKRSTEGSTQDSSKTTGADAGQRKSGTEAPGKDNKKAETKSTDGAVAGSKRKPETKA